MLHEVQWLCALAAMFCNSAPDITAIQTAYEREASADSAFHDTSLQVLQAQCRGDDNEKFLCEVTFISKGDRERPYFDLVTLARAGDAWQLKSGLCKH